MTTSATGERPMFKFFGSKNDPEAKEAAAPEESTQDTFHTPGEEPLAEINKAPLSCMDGNSKTPDSVLRDILSRMEVSGQVFMEKDMEGGIRLDIQGEDGALLIGEKGQTLDALEYLLNRICSRNQGNGRKILVDTENYRKKREEKIVSLAHRLAEKVEKTGRPEIVNPLNPSERKIIHTTLRDYAALETQSEGEGFLKKITISLKKDQ